MILRKDRDWIETSQFLAKKFSKCCRAQYAAIYLNKLGHLVGAGYNGKPRGCDDGVCYRLGPEPPGACCIHAEDNATSWSDPRGREEGTVYVSGTPCDQCALRLLNSGVARLVYLVDSSTCTTGHKCNIVGKEFWDKFKNAVEVVPFTFEEWDKLYSERPYIDVCLICEKAGREECWERFGCSYERRYYDIERNCGEQVVGASGCNRQAGGCGSESQSEACKIEGGVSAGGGNPGELRRVMFPILGL